MKADVLKKISVVFLVVAIAMILFFTFQAPDASLKLSEKVRGWLCNHGMEFNRFTFRTNVHLVEYFIVGIALTIYVKCHDYRCWIATAVGCGIGFLDE